MEFLTNNEDQLLYLGITENGNETPLSISYDSKYIGNPTQIGNKSLVWEGIIELMFIVGNESLLNEPITQSVLIFSCFTIIGIISIWSYIFYIKQQDGDRKIKKLSSYD